MVEPKLPENVTPTSILGVLFDWFPPGAATTDSDEVSRNSENIIFFNDIECIKQLQDVSYNLFHDTSSSLFSQFRGDKWLIFVFIRCFDVARRLIKRQFGNPLCSIMWKFGLINGVDDV